MDKLKGLQRTYTFTYTGAGIMKQIYYVRIYVCTYVIWYLCSYVNVHYASHPPCHYCGQHKKCCNKAENIICNSLSIVAKMSKVGHISRA